MLDLEKYKAEQGRARDLGFDYVVIRNIILQANSDFEDGISVGKAIELIREIGLQAVDKAVAEERAAEVERLRALLHEAYHELHTIDAFTVTPTPPDEFFNLVRRIKEELEQK